MNELHRFMAEKNMDVDDLAKEANLDRDDVVKACEGKQVKKFEGNL